jgi:uncharacterized repeat protein (TIGR03803 family)
MQHTLSPVARVAGRFPISKSLVIAIAAIASAGSAFATPPTETILYNFVGTNGGYPDGPLLIGPSNNVFGTTAYGGATNHGAVIELIPPTINSNPWTEVVLYSFTGGSDGAQPAAGLVFDTAGNLYGTTENSSAGGHGVVFELSPPVVEGGPWTETTIYSFSGVPDGANPNSGLIFDASGDLYGTTTAGGKYNAGTIFELIPPTSNPGTWTESLIYNFTGQSDGGSPFANLVQDGSGDFYGTTTTGGKNLNGTVFALRPGRNGLTLTTIYSFTGGADGGIPYSPVTVGSKGAIFGTTFFGGETVNGVGSYGVVFELAPPLRGTTYNETAIFTFNGTDGANPSGGLLPDGTGGFYGTTAGGVAGYGNVFHLTQPTSGKVWNETVVYAFSGTGGDGQGPLGAVVLSPNGNLLGTTYYGGAWGEGTAFQILLNPCPSVSAGKPMC